MKASCTPLGCVADHWVCRKSLVQIQPLLRRCRLVVRITGFHPVGRGSNPRIGSYNDSGPHGEGASAGLISRSKVVRFHLLSLEGASRPLSNRSCSTTGKCTRLLSGGMQVRLLPWALNLAGWRNWLAQSYDMRLVGGSSPPPAMCVDARAV